MTYMNVLILNGSPRRDGNTTMALNEMLRLFSTEGIDTTVFQVGNKEIRGCIACNRCAELGRCVFNDGVNEIAEQFEKADGLVVATPVYYASANGTLISLLDRLFYSTSFDKTMKVGACIVVARRGGCSAAFDQLNKYFLISDMPVAASRYWNSVHGMNKGEAEFDAEGLLTVRELTRNMAFLMRSIALGKEKFGLPQKETPQYTNFIKV